MLGIIARSDNSGLGNQTYNLVRLLKPQRVMLINFYSFNQMEQYPERYKDYNCYNVKGFATDRQVREFLKGLDTVITCEIFYNPNFIRIARQMGVKTINQFNYEFLDYLQDPSLLLPDVLLSPSYWHIEETRAKYNAIYLPPPVITKDFKAVEKINLKRSGKPRILHIVGKPAIHDRNGTNTIYRALEKSMADYELVIKSQYLLDEYYDERLTYDYSNPDNYTELYKDFDLLVYPRRYGGLALPMNEALIAGLPVFMTDIEPNNQVLPKDWLIPAMLVGKFMTRTLIDIYEADATILADMLDNFTVKFNDKRRANELGYELYSDSALIERYKNLI